ncbi:potassium voltage-gated channel protein Shaw-like [Babylonia areolata]|uniref:potassium voltage-gated channel protein Shaw-like n=1 Tax=Babylonia areolata TaxID=304850 RepID=UPI003FD36444
MSGRKGRSKDHPTVLSALLPGSQITEPTRRILVNTANVREVVTFNIGGTIFQTYRSTLHKLPGSPLADEAFLHGHFIHDRQQYFFDRDPDVFGAILNYLRTGELHLPTKYCGPAVKTEMEFWGIGEDEIEECCWTSYSAWTTTLLALRKLEKDRKVHLAGCAQEAALTSSDSKLRHLAAKGWTLINNPRSSKAAKIFSFTSLGFVLLSIFSFIAQTHPTFRVPVATPAGTDTDTHTGPGTNRSLPNALNVSTPRGESSGQGESTLEDEAHPWLVIADYVCLVFFLLEFASRVALAPRRCRLLLMPMTILEMLALFPDVMELCLKPLRPSLGDVSAVDVITFLRLLRVFRIFRLMRHFPGLWILFYTLKASVRELLLLLLFLCVGMLFFASLIYYVDDRKLFPSIPHACWWSIITMTTVGYGDVSPVTELGYVVGSVTAVCGVLVIGFTVPVLVNNFILYYQHTQSALARETNRRGRGLTTSPTSPKLHLPSPYPPEGTSGLQHVSTATGVASTNGNTDHPIGMSTPHPHPHPDPVLTDPSSP